MPMQALVIAHASYGHNSFFKGNYLFRTWTQPDAIIDYLLSLRSAVHENASGVSARKRWSERSTRAMPLANFGVDRYKRPAKRSLAQERVRLKEREEHLQQQVNELWRTLPRRQTESAEPEEQRFPPEPQENLLYFLEKHAPLLEPWQRESRGSSASSRSISTRSARRK